MRTTRRMLLGALPGGIGAAVMLRSTTWAATWPSGTIRLYVGFSPGGGTDLTARIIAEKLTQRLGVSVVVDNRLGASGDIASGIVARAPADGNSLLLVAIPFVVEPAIHPDLPFDPLKDFAPITMIASAPNVIMINRALGVSNVKELVALARKEPDKIAFASSGVGTSTHLATELFMQKAGIRLVHVPYHGGGAALAGLLSGEVSIYIASVPAATSYMHSDKLQVLAVTGPSRSASLPGIPTVAEAGVPDYQYIGWYGLLAPARTSPAIIGRLRDQVAQIVKLPDVSAQLRKDGAEPVADSPDAFGAFLKTQIAQWKQVMAHAQTTRG